MIPSVTTIWKTALLAPGFMDPVPACTIQVIGSMDLPAVVRMQNVTSGSFEIRLQNPGDQSDSVSAHNVHCLVVEAGSWSMPDGSSIEAQTYTSTVTDRKYSWNGQPQTYLASYQQPVVLGQVLTFNDPGWSVFWCRSSSSESDPPDSDSLRTGKHVGEDSNTIRSDETVGFIVIEAGHSTTGGLVYEADLGTDIVQGYDNNANGYLYSYSTAFSSTPAVTVAGVAAVDGGDGSWAILRGYQSASALRVVIDEDQRGDSERSHTTEQVFYVSFQTEVTLSRSPGAVMQSMVVPQVSTIFQTVPLAAGFMNPVPVCTIQAINTMQYPAVVRMRNVTAGSFDIRLQIPGDEGTVNQDVHCVVVEEGSWSMPDGRQIEAQKYTSTVTDRKYSWNGQPQTYLASYQQPVVLGQVLTFNDSRWSVFWCRGSSQSNPPDSTSLSTGKHVGEDPDTTRDDETVGFIVIEAGHSTTGGLVYEANLGTDIVQGYDNNANGYLYTYSPSFATTPVTVATLSAMDGVDGGWAILIGDQTASTLRVVIDEDQLNGVERAHTHEQVAYVAFETEGAVTLTPSA